MGITELRAELEQVEHELRWLNGLLQLKNERAHNLRGRILDCEAQNIRRNELRYKKKDLTSTTR